MLLKTGTFHFGLTDLAEKFVIPPSQLLLMEYRKIFAFFNGIKNNKSPKALLTILEK